MKHKFFKFLTPILLFVGLGISPNAWGFGGFTSNSDHRIYFDNSTTDWEAASFAAGSDNSSLKYPMSKVTNTKLFYAKVNVGNWGIGWVTIFSKDWGTEQDGSYENYKSYASPLLSKYEGDYKFQDGSTDLITTSGSISPFTFIPNYVGGWNDYDNLNYTQTIMVKVSTDGGTTYDEVSSSPAQITIKSYELTDDGTTGSQQTSTLSKGDESTTRKAARTATTTLSCGTPNANYTFQKWMDEDGNTVTSPYYPTKAQTIYACFTYTEPKYTVSLVADPSTYGQVNANSVQAGSVGKASISATANNCYSFVNWTGTTGISFDDANSASTKVAATQAGTATANFTQRFYLRGYLKDDSGNGGMPGWGNDAPFVYANSEFSVTRTLTVGKEYKFMVYDKTADKQKGCKDKSGNAVIPWNTPWTCDDNYQICFTPELTGDYKFVVEQDGEDPKVKIVPPSINALYSNFSGIWGRTNGTVTDGVLTVEYNLQESEIKDGLKFKMIYEGTYYGASLENQSMTPDNHAGLNLSAGDAGKDILFVPSVAGRYTFKFTNEGKGMEIIYPTLPAATTTTTEARHFGEDALASFIGGDGSEEHPYLVYTDEKIAITATALAAQDHLTAMYQFGEDEASAEVLTKTIAVTSAEKKPIEVKAFYQVDGYNAKGETTAKTIYYQGVPYPQLFLTSNLTNDETELDQAPDNVTISYTTENYDGSTTITKNGASWQTPDREYHYTEPLTKSIHADTYVATAEVYGRTFTTSLVVSVYRYVQVKVKDADSKWAKNVYMWKSGTDKKNAEWPGEALVNQLGDWYIFAVKYPTYDNFVINDGQQTGKQTIDLAIPTEEICYEIGNKKETKDGKDYYNCSQAQCPNGLYVGDIANVNMYNGESTTVSPVVQLDPSLSEDDLQINFTYSPGGIVNATQSGKNIMLSATSTGTTTVTATYSINGAESISKSFTVTVTGAVLIQVSITTDLEWNNKDEIHIKYFNHGLDSEKKMKWDHFYNGQDYYSARIPVGSDGQIDFMIHAWQIENEHFDHQTVDVQDVSGDGCYCVLTEQESNQKRKMRYEGSLCWEEYQVKIVMGNGTTYYSNK
ncbi:MAG: hypothetical protein MJZ20_10050, partial [Bacteroidaceae bacterium]|nr:hypothetical protein [Bacteroidaceae bacterium]